LYFSRKIFRRRVVKPFPVGALDAITAGDGRIY